MAKTDKKDKKSVKAKPPLSVAKVPISSTEILAKAAAVATGKVKVTAKPAKKKGSDSSDSEAPLHKVVANGKDKKPQESSSDESTESSSEEEKPKAAQVKAAIGKPASSGSSSSSSEDEKPQTKKPSLAKAKPSSHPNATSSTKKQQVKASSSDDLLDSGGKVVKKTFVAQPASKIPPKIVSQPKQLKKSQADSEEESSDESSSDDEPKKTKVSQNADSSSDSSSDSESDEESNKKVKAIPEKTVSSSSSSEESSSSSEESSSSSEESSDDSDEESIKNVRFSQASPTKAKVALAKAASSTFSSSDGSAATLKSKIALTKEASSSEEPSEGSSDEDGDVKMGDSTAAPLKTSKRKATDDAPAPPKKAKLDHGNAAPAGDKTGETKTIFVGRLSWSVDNDRLAQEFASCGEVVSATVQMDRDTGKSRGFGYVHFATSDAVEKALGMNGMEIDGRSVNIDRSTQLDKAQAREKRAKAFGDSTNPPSSTLFVGNLSFSVTEDAVWSFFNDYGVKSVRLPTDRESGRPKGFGYVEFEDVEGAKKAFEASKGAEIEGRPIRLDYSQPRDGPGGSGGRNDFGRGRGQGRGRGWGGDRGGRGGRGGRGARGGLRRGGFAAFEGRKITF